MNLVTLPAGSRGIDCAFPLTASLARAVKAAGYDFVMRYIPRQKPTPDDLTTLEITSIFNAGLRLGVVQHVKSEKSWQPDGQTGFDYGTAATSYGHLLRLPDDATIWCDQEGVDVTCSSVDVMNYGHAWYTAMAFDAGLYVGWHCGLSPEMLWELPFKRYWGAYNLNEDEYPVKRGIQMKQHAAVKYPPIAGLTFESYDVNTVQADLKGDLPVFIGA